MYLWLRGGLLDCFAWPAKVGSRRVDGVLCCLCVCLIPRAITIITLLELHWCGPATSSEFTWLTEAAPARPASRLVLPERVALMSKEDRNFGGARAGYAHRTWALTLVPNTTSLQETFRFTSAQDLSGHMSRPNSHGRQHYGYARRDDTRA